MHPIFVPRAIVQAHKLHLLCTDDVEKCIFALRVHLFSDCIQCRGNLEEEHLRLSNDGSSLFSHWYGLKKEASISESHKSLSKFVYQYVFKTKKEDMEKLGNLDWKTCKYFPNKFAKGFHLSLLHCIASCDKCQQINVKSTLDKCKSCI